MVGDGQTQDGVPAETVLALVEALYAYAEHPAHWRDITAAVEALPSPLDPQRDPAARAIITHAARAAAMLDRLNAGRPGQQRDVASWDAVLLSSEAIVRGVVGNIAARLKPFLAKPIDIGKRLIVARQSEKIFSTALTNALATPEPVLIPFKLGSSRESPRCFGVVLPRAAFPQSLVADFELSHVWTEPLFAVVLLSTQDGAATGSLLNRNLGLTHAESRLATKLLQGLAINDAARELEMREATARWHIKNIYAKTGAQRQPELLRLLRDASEFPKPGNVEAMSLPGGTPARRFVTLPDGRRLFYREYGDSSGAPVVYFHFGLCASMLPPAAATAAARARVHVISFERPGFGQSDPRPDYTFDKIAEDAEELCRRLKLRNVSLFGDGYGGGFAVAAARNLGGAINKIALHAPNLGRSPGDGGAQKGLSVFSAQLWIVPLAAELLRKGLRIGVIRSLMSYVAQRSRLDAARINDPGFDHYLGAAVFDALEKTSAGLASETIMFGKGLRTDATGIKCPIAVWYGAENSVVPPSRAVQDFGDLPNAKVKVFPNVGLFLGEDEFAEIFAWLAKPPSKNASADL